MRKIIVLEWLSLDGFVADENNNLDFFTASNLHKYSDHDTLKFMDDIDLILLGRKTYGLFVDFWPNATNDKEVIADKLNSTAKAIVSETLISAPWGKWPEASLVKADVINEIKKMKAAPGKNIVLWGSVSLAQSLMKANLIDEYHFRICPVALGAGKPFFSKTARPENLQLTGFKKYESGLVSLEYEP